MTTLDMTKGVYRRIYSACRKGKRINQVSAMAELVFWRLHCIADDFGTFESEPRFIKAEAFPIKEDVAIFHIVDALNSLANAELIHLFEIEGERFGAIVGFEEFQPANKNGRRIQRFPFFNGESWGIRVNPTNANNVDFYIKNKDGGILGNPGESGCDLASENIPRIYREHADATAPTAPAVVSNERKAGRKSKATSILPPGFIRFWDEWPNTTRKSCRTQCVKFWTSRGCEDIAGAIVDSVRRFKASADWTKNGGQFIPGPMPWLRSEAWEVPAAAFAGSAPTSEPSDDRGTPESNAEAAGVSLEEYAKSLQCRELFPGWSPNVK